MLENRKKPEICKNYFFKGYNFPGLSSYPPPFQIYSPIKPFKDASEGQITLTTIAVCCKFVRDVITVSLPIAPNLIMDASSLVCTKAETRPSAIVAIAGVLVRQVPETVEDKVVRLVIVIVAVQEAVTHLRYDILN